MTKRMQKKVEKKLDAAFEKAWKTTPLYTAGTGEKFKVDCEVMFMAGVKAALETFAEPKG